MKSHSTSWSAVVASNVAHHRLVVRDAICGDLLHGVEHNRDHEVDAHCIVVADLMPDNRRDGMPIGVRDHAPQFHLTSNLCQIVFSRMSRCIGYPPDHQSAERRRGAGCSLSASSRGVSPLSH